MWNQIVFWLFGGGLQHVFQDEAVNLSLNRLEINKVGRDDRAIDLIERK